MTSVRRLLLTAAALSICAVRTPPLRAQVSAGADVFYRGHYLWRGLSRASGDVLQPDVYLSYRRAGALFVLGVWTSASLGSPAHGEPGNGSKAFREFEPWAELAVPISDWIDLTGGMLHHRFDAGADAGAARSGMISTSEIYARLRSRALPVITPQLVIYRDIDAVQGTYIEGGLDVRVPGWARVAVPLGSLVLSARLGTSSGMTPNRERPLEFSYYARDGLTHVDFGASTLIGPVPILDDGANTSLLVGWHVQDGLDPATRTRVGATAGRWTQFWEIGVSVAGPHCRPARRICP